MPDAPAVEMPRPTRSALVAWTVGLIASIAVALAGYLGFRWGAPQAHGGATGAGLLALAALVGFLVLFSPCSFPLLVAMLVAPPVSEDDHPARRGKAAYRSALAVGAGAAAFLMIVGLVIGVIGTGITRWVGFPTTGGRIVRGVVAAVLVLSGLAQLGVVSLPWGRLAGLADPIARRRQALDGRHQHRGEVLYGFAFVLAGIG